MVFLPTLGTVDLVIPSMWFEIFAPVLRAGIRRERPVFELFPPILDAFRDDFPQDVEAFAGFFHNYSLWL